MLNTKVYESGERQSEFMKICPCCMEEHEVKIITIQEKNVFKGIPVEYYAEYHYCSQADEIYADEQQISANDISMKKAYREKMHESGETSPDSH